MVRNKEQTRTSGPRRHTPRQSPRVEELELRELLSHTLVVGHRGNSGLAPENTLASVRQAFDAGADVVEADIQFAADGTIVLMHDTTVDRTTDGAGAVASLTIEQLKSLDAGSWFSAAYAGERVPTLAEALEAARGRGILYLDLKSDGMGAAIDAVLDKLGLTDTAIWTSANLDPLAADVHEQLPGTPILWWGDVPARSDAVFLARMRELGVVGFDLRWGEFSRRFQRDAQAAGMLFSTYTLDRPADLRAAQRLDLDAIETNFPGRLATRADGSRDNVAVELDGTTLVVLGDRNDNRIRIESGAVAGSVRVTGLDGTLLNQQAGSIEFAAVQAVQLSLDRGDDVIDVIALSLEGELSIHVGVGNGRITIDRATVAGMITIDAGPGVDWLRVSESEFAQLVADGSAGTDHLDTRGLADSVKPGLRTKFSRFERALE